MNFQQAGYVIHYETARSGRRYRARAENRCGQILGWVFGATRREAIKKLKARQWVGVCRR